MRQKWIDGELVEVGSDGRPVEEAASDQQQLVDLFSQALSGETSAEGEDSSWVQIGGIKFGQTALVKSPLGEALFTINIEAASPSIKSEHANIVYPVIVKRSEDGGVDRISIDFTRHLAYSNLCDNWNLEQQKKAFDVLEKLGVLNNTGTPSETVKEALKRSK